MAPGRRTSSGNVAGRQGSGISATPQQRHISSFFSPKSFVSSPPAPAQDTGNIKKPVLRIGHLESACKSHQDSAKEPSSPPAKRRKLGNEMAEQARAREKKNAKAETISTPSPSEAARPAKSIPRNSISSVEPENSFDLNIERGFFNPESYMGQRLKVYWALDDAWYEGVVKAYEKSSGRHVIRYEDGEEESLILENEKIQWLDVENDANVGQPVKLVKHSLRRLRKVCKQKEPESCPVNLFDLKVETGSPNPPTNTELGVSSPPKNLESEARKSEDSRPKRVHRRVTYVDNDSDHSVDDVSDGDEEWTEAGKLMEDSEDGEEELDLEDEAEEIGKKRRKSYQRHSSSPNQQKRRSTKSKTESQKELTPPSGKKPPSRKKSLLDSKEALKTDSKKGVVGFFCQNIDDNRDESCPNMKDKPTDRSIGGESSVHLTGEAEERFGRREAEKFKFLGKGRRDAAGRPVSHPDYDARTLQLPEAFLKGVSGGQRQWWDFKSKHMDKVLFFKMGKFYEMFEMDAHIGAQELDLQYMKSEQPHCGFPEKNFSENAQRLAQKGYRVLVVEQTETPDQLDQRKKETGTKDKVVKREICAVITKGTMTEGDMLAANPDAAYLMSVFEACDVKVSNGSSMIGVCFVDASTGRFMLGQFLDDAARSCLRTLLSELRPVELVKPRGMLTLATEKALIDQTRNPLVTNLIPEIEFWDSKKTLEEIVKLFTSLSERSKSKSDISCNGVEIVNRLDVLPKLLHSIAGAGVKGEAVLCALGGCISYLRQVLLDQNLLSFGTFEHLPGSDIFYDPGLPNSFNTKDEMGSGRINFSADSAEAHLVLDATALENLEILENNRNGGISGTLLACLDHCVTVFGRRLLRRWLVRPLLSVDSILQRQNAIKDLKGVAADAAIKFRKDLARLPDMERLLARLYASSEASGRNAQGVVLYEDEAKKQLKEFIACLHGFQTIAQVLSMFRNNIYSFSSTKLQQLLTPEKGITSLSPLLEHFELAFDWKEAEKTGRILPHEGVDKTYDLASAAVSDAEGELELYLEKQRKHFGKNSEITYVTVGKERFQLQIPDSLQENIPSEYEAMSSKKGFRRFWTPRIKELLHELAVAEEQKELALKGIMQGLVRHFCKDYSKWLSVVHTVAELDVLISLMVASDSMAGQTCQPEIKFDTTADSSPFLVAKGLRHPILEGSLLGGGSFVPNDVSLGGKGQAPLMLLTGPNMGGKSTLLRQVCLAVILCQVGANVPAESFQISLVDRVFVRMGAKDHIMAGQSTFLIELSETASMLISATRHSLVALDELGRGTATSDGQAIAHAVLEHLAHETCCRGIFSTHYHRLADDHANDPKIALYHMACKVGTSDKGIEEVTFLYKLAHGACPKSYGVNVARIAGVPEEVLQRAATCKIEDPSFELVGQEPDSGVLRSGLFQELLWFVQKTSSSRLPESSNMNYLYQLWEKARHLSHMVERSL